MRRLTRNCGGGWCLLVVWLMLPGGGCGLRPLPPQAALVRARKAVDDGDWAAACRRFGLVARSQWAGWWAGARGLAQCLGQLGRLGEAEAHARMIARIHGPAGEAYFRAFVAAASGPRFFPETRRLLRRAARLAPGDWEPAYRLGLLALAGEDWAAAGRWFQRATVRGGDGRALVALARVLVLQGRIREGLDALHRAAESKNLSPDLVRRGLRVGVLAERLGAPWGLEVWRIWRKAARLLETHHPGQAVELLRATDLEHPALDTLLGVAQLRLGNDAQATAALRRAFDANPYAYEAAVALGRLALETRRAAHAVRFLERAVRVSPFDGEANALLGIAYSRIGQYARAEPFLHRAVRLGRTAAIVERWAKVLSRLGRPLDAARALEAAIREGGTASQWVLVGDLYREAYSRKKDDEEAEHLFKKAVSAYKRALEIQPGQVGALARLKALGVDVTRFVEK